MAEIVVSLAGQHVLPKFMEAANVLRDLSKEVEDIKDELESFQDFINDADKVAEAEEDNNKREIIKKRVNRLREAVFCMEDVVDEYNICDENQPDDPGCATLSCEVVGYIKTLILQIAYKIQHVQSHAQELKKRYGLQGKLPLEQRPNSSRGNQNVTRHNLRILAPLYNEEVDVVGFDGPRDKLKDWLIKGCEEGTVISIVGMRGLGKTTLAKLVFYHKEVIGRFDCHAWITVSQPYILEGVLRHILHKLCKEKLDHPFYDVSTMQPMSMIEEVRNSLRNKSYVVVFDGSWNTNFWNDIKFSLIDNKNGSRILITTRNNEVAEFCKKSSFIQVHKLEPLSEEKSFEMLFKVVFWSGFVECDPKEYEEVGLEIVRKCECLPLAIVAIGGLLSQKVKSAAEWKQFSQNLSLELERNNELNSMTKIIGLSYDDLPFNIRPCLLYFGMYPED